MTHPNQAPEIDPLAQFDKLPAVSFNPLRTNDDGTPNPGHAMGEWAVLRVTGYADMVQRRDEKTKKPMVYEDSGKPMMSMVIPVEEQNPVTKEWEKKNVWGKIPGGLLTALRQAQAELQVAVGDPNRRLRAGDTLALRWSANGVKTSTDPSHSPPKIFEAKIKPGVEPPPSGNQDPFETAAAAPTATPQAASQPAAAQTPAPQQPRPQVGGDPFSTPVADAAAAAPAQQPVVDDPFATQGTPNF